MILGDIIDKAYNNNLEPLKPQVSWSLLQNVFSAEEQLTEWKKTLPSAFTLPPRQYLHPVARTGSIKGRYSIIIWLRYNNVRTLLHRVVLGAFLASTSDESCLKEHSEALYWAGVGSIEACLNSATESLDTLYQVSGSQDLLPAWWYSIYYSEFSPSLEAQSSRCKKILKQKHSFYVGTGRLRRHRRPSQTQAALQVPDPHARGAVDPDAKGHHGPPGRRRRHPASHPLSEVPEAADGLCAVAEAVPGEHPATAGVCESVGGARLRWRWR